MISALAPNAKIILFGSRARGRFSEFSDIDIALNAKERLPNLLMGERTDVLAATDIILKVQVLDYNFVSDALKHSIDREGIVWKS